ncbi:MAG: hypothetical protein KY476_21235 [Planctomycetes bacterium]|nr:hypothetical protein [Planctomycetota bacterium]
MSPRVSLVLKMLGVVLIVIGGVNLCLNVVGLVREPTKSAILSYIELDAVAGLSELARQLAESLTYITVGVAAFVLLAMAEEVRRQRDA